MTVCLFWKQGCEMWFTFILGKWECPWHHCDDCGKVATKLCSECPNSFCEIHDKEENIVEFPDGLIYCTDHDELIETVKSSKSLDQGGSTSEDANENGVELEKSDTVTGNRKEANDKEKRKRKLSAKLREDETEKNTKKKKLKKMKKQPKGKKKMKKLDTDSIPVPKCTIVNGEDDDGPFEMSCSDQDDEDGKLVMDI